MKKTIASAVVGLSLSTLLVVPAMANTAMNGTGSSINGQPTITNNGAYGSTTTFNKPNAFGTPGSTGTPDVYGVPGTTKLYSDTNGRMGFNGSNAYYRYGNNGNVNTNSYNAPGYGNMNSYSYGTATHGNLTPYSYNGTSNRYTTASYNRANNLRATAVDTTTKKSTNWGWLGLLGLIGLAGMRSRSSDNDRERA
ncbi:WGxxGxxG family protein [Paenibacillus albus]|uniref:WGxxGxxG-CTERM domain-containing protein n=1 Tax=Paenibacillus albus TaxID=2495582 RepID=A0A3Q8X8D6_9BACL|nr:WGxxGxxG family protein [Paenibacillus albus]AZN42702.1 hypothetical protein EJC50_25690 [Paenibacillus albus]